MIEGKKAPPDKFGAHLYKHGLRKHPLYGIWCHIKERCSKDACPAYPDYGGRGITVCSEWINDAEAFITWAIDAGWTTGLFIDRIDNDGPYSPENCRWTDRKTNNNNKRGLVMVTVEGQQYSLAEAVEKFSVQKYGTVYYRLKKGWSVQDALFGARRINQHG